VLGDGDDLDAFATESPSPERVVAARGELERVARALRGLPVGQRQSILLVLEGFTHAEIAEMTGVSESAISVRVHRARAALTASLEEDSHE
jgi:RNA polymerase sigma-70 factor (ECF subfamily)